MKRKALDWMYVNRWLPWIAIVLIMPLLLWPAGWWFSVERVHVNSARLGEPLTMIVERMIERPFRATWQVTVRQWQGEGWVAYCNASGTSNYRPEAKFPNPLTLQWWTNGQCYPLPVGRYKVITAWKIDLSDPIPDKDVTIESNIFAVLP